MNTRFLGLMPGARLTLLCAVASIAALTCCGAPPSQPPLLDPEWSAEFDNIWSDLDANTSYENAGWVHSSYSQLCTRSDQAGGGLTPQLFSVVDNFTANIANVMDITNKSCSVTPTESGFFESPDILRQLGFVYNGTFAVPLLGEEVLIDEWYVKLPDGPTHKDNIVTVYAKAGTAERVLYQISLLEPPPPPEYSANSAVAAHYRSPAATLRRILSAPAETSPGAPSAVLHRVLSQVWYHGYSRRTVPWPMDFFNVTCPWTDSI